MGHNNLNELEVGCYDHQNVSALLDALHMNYTLERLTIKGLRSWAIDMRYGTIKMVGIKRLKTYLPDDVRSCISSELAKMLIQNKALKELDICNYELDLQGDISTVLCENCTLRKLSISVERGPELEAISEL